MKRGHMVLALFLDNQLCRVQIFSLNFTPAQMLSCVPPSHVTTYQYNKIGNPSVFTSYVNLGLLTVRLTVRIFVQLVYFSRLSFGFACGEAMLKGGTILSRWFRLLSSKTLQHLFFWLEFNKI